MLHRPISQFAVTGSDALNRNDARWTLLRELIRKHSLMTGNYTLSSGKRSHYLFQLRQVTMLPEAAWLFGEAIVEFMQAHGLTTVGGLAVGAVPLVSAVSVMSHKAGAPVDAFFVRKEPKTHGAKERVDGHLKDGSEILMVDDVATTGGSVLKALEGIREEDRFARCEVTKALVLVDREEGAEENLRNNGIQLYSFFKRSDFGL